MGVLNLTPDSFSDGGQWVETETAIAHGLDMLAQGADIIDVGGESTRPGAQRVSEQEELRRVLPVVTALADAGAVVSIDTMRAATAQAAVACGARMVNDVSGGLADPGMPEAIAQTDVAYVAMHWRGHGDVMDAHAHYEDVVTEVVAHLRDRVSAFTQAGVDPQRIIVDPGLGFAKTAEHNWQLLANVDALAALGHPLLFGASRKRFLAQVVDQPRAAGQRHGGDGQASFDHPLTLAGQAQARDGATAALTAVLAGLGVWGVRVHEVRANLEAARVVQALTGARSRNAALVEQTA